MELIDAGLAKANEWAVGKGRLRLGLGIDETAAFGILGYEHKLWRDFSAFAEATGGYNYRRHDYFGSVIGGLEYRF